MRLFASKGRLKSGFDPDLACCPSPAVNAKLAGEYAGTRLFHSESGRIASVSIIRPAK